MKIPEELWQEIIAETKTRLADWEARLVAEGCQDRFVVRVEQLSSTVEAIITEQQPRMYGPAHVVIRHRDTGEMHRATRKQAGKGRFKISWKSVDPKSWAKLADKPAAAWVKELKLTDFVVILGATMTGVRSESLHNGPKPAA